jgi:hypothetical protein
MSLCDSLPFGEKCGWTFLHIIHCQSKAFAVMSGIRYKIFVVSELECEVNWLQPWLKVVIVCKRAKILVNMK